MCMFPIPNRARVSSIWLVNKGLIRKLDTSGFETSMPTTGFGSSNDMLDGLFGFIRLLVWLICFGFQFDGFQKEAVQMVKPAKGTTTLAFIFKEGVMGPGLYYVDNEGGRLKRDVFSVGFTTQRLKNA
ncbi:hypothetical protein Bca52824_075077 [Brassica carinata]|uniref:Uncharacterized protein n=1 Tax=Brassica carinata TaxID=52824 RepID=A0A8X7PSB0_BRACI|nr:hypothetical protein Bca52824_075077 [Brassica carinata]